MDILPASGNQSAMGYLQFRLNMDSLVNTADFSNLFANYRVTCIVTTLTPMFQGNDSNPPTAADNVGAFYSWQSYSPQCIVTKVHGKYLNEPFEVAANGLAQREELSQIQAKTKTKMYKPRDIKLVTKYPATYKLSVADPAQPTTTSVVRDKSRWLSWQNDRDMEFAHNDTIFVERVDGGDLTTDWKFRVTHKVYFKCSYVG
jgi:hypothetical protein